MTTKGEKVICHGIMWLLGDTPDTWNPESPPLKNPLNT